MRTVTFAVVVDTTERVLTEQKRREVEERFQHQQEQLVKMFRQSPSLIAVVSGDNFVVEMANPLFRDTFARGKDIVGKPLFESLPHLKKNGERILRRVLATGEPVTGIRPVISYTDHAGKPSEKHLRYANIPLVNRVDGKPDGIFIHAIDITDEVLSRRKSEELSLLLKAVYESLPDGLIIAQEDVVTYINQCAAEVLGFDSPDKVPRSIRDIFQRLEIRFSVGGKLFKAEDSALKRALKGEAVMRVGIETTNLLTGRKQILRTAGAPVRNKEGELIGAVVVITDLTELYALQKRVQQEEIRREILAEKARLLKEQNEQLTQLNTAKEEFIALTSHQLRTPATGVKQYIAMLMQGYVGKLTPEQQEFLEKAYESNEQQLLIIEEILRVAKVDIGKMKLECQRTDIGALVHGILDEHRERLNKHGLVLHAEIPSKPLWIYIDPLHIRMAIGNLVDNAIKYSPNNKDIFVRVWKSDQKHASIAVTDQGVGIADSDIGKLFLKFSRIPNSLSKSVGGTGLGLYWTKRMVELHSGEITVDSKVGKGTTFTIRLPVSVKDTNTVTAKTATQS